MASKTKKIVWSSLVVSILLHLIILGLGTVIFVFYPEEQKHPNMYIPSYVYTPKTTSMPTPTAARTIKRTPAQEQKRVEPPVVKEKAMALKPQQQPKPASMLAASFNYLQQTQMESMRAPAEEEPILLIGDENETPDLLTKLIAQSLSAHFAYPKEAGMFGISGRVLLRMTLEPSGNFTDIQMVKSSENDQLDSAALYAANSAPRVVGADRFLQKPKRFVIGFIFRLR